ncbi:hypothetical protein EDI_282690 [Entamoeba dispar SAW760]|uniref:Protein kinase domain-containing protein n=1 Tax=Entamoeba dispar (strain ATCC PRA-260 / SAW760) TaxID=370354 RepID=B0EGQ8_ENTDS|nr:uncharacterized protein EDI_282690 [Entamoeba dispar SAW760]EDR26298.1 hypothetical protein EDI_282690 [Entamoeba dispar SAW760]|eukprot:EDR26298.1 hypothetical protein EDI_282690 [Entamoeba dispar SAW760]
MESVKRFNKYIYYISTKKCNSPYIKCYMNESNKEMISIRFSLIKTNKREIICKIILELIDVIVILHKKGSFHGNLNEERIIIDKKENNISLGRIGKINGEYNKEEMKKKDYEDIGIIMINIIKYIYNLQPFLLDNLKYNITIPKATSNSKIIFIDNQCNIINLKQIILTKNSIEIITKRNNTIIKYNHSNKEENQIFGEFIKTQIGNEVINQEIILPKNRNDNLQIKLFSKPLISIKLYCNNSFKILQVANQLRSFGYNVKCQKGTMIELIKKKEHDIFQF